MNIEELVAKTKKLSLLFVEDEDNVRAETLSMLKILFEHVDEAENGIIALEKFKEKEYDLVLTDINMPKMNGLVFSKEALEINPSQMIIVLSAHDEMEYIEEMIEVGINKYILKPLNLDDFIDILQEVVEEA
jgi:YesN/AraC family two-component response regulator